MQPLWMFFIDFWLKLKDKILAKFTTLPFFLMIEIPQTNMEIFSIEYDTGHFRIHTSEPDNGAVTRTMPPCCLTGDSCARRIHPDVPLDIAKK